MKPASHLNSAASPTYEDSSFRPRFLFLLEGTRLKSPFSGPLGRGQLTGLHRGGSDTDLLQSNRIPNLLSYSLPRVCILTTFRPPCIRPAPDLTRRVLWRRKRSPGRPRHSRLAHAPSSPAAPPRQCFPGRRPGGRLAQARTTFLRADTSPATSR